MDDLYGRKDQIVFGPKGLVSRQGSSMWGMVSVLGTQVLPAACFVSLKRIVFFGCVWLRWYVKYKARDGSRLKLLGMAPDIFRLLERYLVQGTGKWFESRPSHMWGLLAA